MFTLLTCADMFGTKVNLELLFSALPTIGELTRRIEEVFTMEMHAIKPPGAPLPPDGIRVSRLQVYDDVLLKWTDLVSSTQLHEYDQVYVFQPQTPWQIDTQQDLPAPRPPTGGAAVAPTMPLPGSIPVNPAVAIPASVPAPISQAAAGLGERPNVHSEEKNRIVFDELDLNKKGYLEYADMERAFRDRGLDFSSTTIGELFYKADLNRDGRVTFDEWANWSQIYPNTVECLYFKGRTTDEEVAIQRQIQACYDQVNQNQAREAQIRRELESLETAGRGLEEEIARLQAAATDAGRKKSTLDADERELIEEEVKLERQYDQMRMSKARFQEASDRFNRGAAAKGSPRRARETLSGF